MVPSARPDANGKYIYTAIDPAQSQAAVSGFSTGWRGWWSRDLETGKVQ